MRQLAQTKVLGAELEFERLSNKQELWKRQKEHEKQLESVRKELETEKQKPPAVQEVVFWHLHVHTSLLHTWQIFVPPYVGADR